VHLTVSIVCHGMLILPVLDELFRVQWWLTNIYPVVILACPFNGINMMFSRKTKVGEEDR
jgi:hypothetical protein